LSASSKPDAPDSCGQAGTTQNTYLKSDINALDREFRSRSAAVPKHSCALMHSQIQNLAAQ